MYSGLAAASPALRGTPMLGWLSRRRRRRGEELTGIDASAPGSAAESDRESDDEDGHREGQGEGGAQPERGPARNGGHLHPSAATARIDVAWTDV